MISQSFARSDSGVPNCQGESWWSGASARDVAAAVGRPRFTDSHYELYNPVPLLTAIPGTCHWRLTTTLSQQAERRKAMWSSVAVQPTTPRILAEHENGSQDAVMVSVHAVRP